jgi:hypothetical protein
LDAVGYGTNMYPVESLPTTALVSQAGNRIVTIDYDKAINWATFPTSTINAWGAAYTAYKVDTTTPGLLPAVSHAVGNLFYCAPNGTATEAPTKTFENTTGDLGNVHYYFGFSVMFTTRGDISYSNDPTLMKNRDSDTLGWLTYRQVAPYSEIDARTVVQLDLQSLGTNFQYQGVLNSVNVINQRARYTIAESISGVNSSMDVFNTQYAWLPHNMKGYASESLVPIVTYNQIDSESTNQATIELGAKLAIGLDSAVVLPWDYSSSWTASYAIGLLNAAINPQGYDLAGTMHVYNVEFIYDLVIDVSLNGVPLADYMASYAQGTLDGLLKATEPQPVEIPWLMIALIVILVVVVLRRLG